MKIVNNILLLLMTFATVANAEDSCYYAKVFGGVNFLQNTEVTGNRARYDTGYIIAGSLGYCLPCNLCLEGEYAYRRNGINRIHFTGEGHSKHGHFQTSSFMANLLWDVPLSTYWDFRPFIGAGIGYDSQKMDSSNSRIIFHQNWRHLSWQAMAGVAYPILCNADLTLEYKYHQGGCHFHNHSIGVGLVYRFY